MRPGSFVRFYRTTEGEPDLRIEDLGDAEVLVRNPDRLSETAAALLKKGIVPSEDGWGGWLGRYQSALMQAAKGLKYSMPARAPRRRRERSLGR
jgi:hypothetical protein